MVYTHVIVGIAFSRGASVYGFAAQTKHSRAKSRQQLRLLLHNDCFATTQLSGQQTTLISFLL